jgi:hypothetical protein
VFAVHASGNAPGVHTLWLQALALGYRVAIRPSRREPFTGHRLIHALRQAGFRPEDVVYLPTDYAGADEIIRAADLAMVYGGQDVVDKDTNDPTVFPNGPGRTKILITAEQDWRDCLDIVVDSISNQGGMACVNTTAVLYEGDAAPLARAIADRLSMIEPLPNGSSPARPQRSDQPKPRSLVPQTASHTECREGRSTERGSRVSSTVTSRNTLRHIRRTAEGNVTTSKNIHRSSKAISVGFLRVRFP